MTDFHAFCAIALGFSTGTVFFTLLFWAIVKRGR